MPIDKGYIQSFYFLLPQAEIGWVLSALFVFKKFDTISACLSVQTVWILSGHVLVSHATNYMFFVAF